MADEAITRITHVEVQQDTSQSSDGSTAEAEGYLEQTRVDAQVKLPLKRQIYSGMKWQQDQVTVTESRQVDAAGGSKSRQVDAAGGSKSQRVDVVGVVSRKLTQDSASSVTDKHVELLPGCSDLVYSPGRQNSQESFTGSSSTGDSRETAVVGDSSRRASLESGRIGDISNSLDLLDGIAAGGSSTRESRFFRLKPAVVKSNRQLSLERGVTGGISNSLDSEESPNGTLSWDGLVEPFPTGAVPTGAIPTGAALEENEDPRVNAVQQVVTGYADCFNTCACVCNYLRPYTRRIRKSKYFQVIEMILLLMSMITSTMGIIHKSDCPVKHELPILVLVLGLVGLVVIISSNQSEPRAVSCRSIHKYCFTAVLVTARIIFLGLFATILHYTYSISPSFDPENHETYCSIVFYYFTYYVNFVISGIAVLAFFLCAPNITESCDDYEEL